MEEDKPDGTTAMERLCREMAECVVELLPAAWCRNHGINDGAPWSQCKGIARADIEPSARTRIYGRRYGE